MSQKRTPKSKSQIKHDIKQVQDTNRKREIVREVIFPHLVSLNESIGFTKIFLQTASTTLESTFAETQRSTKVAALIPRIKEIFSSKDKKLQAEYNKYLALFELLKDESISDFVTLIQVMPRVIEQYYTKENDKRPMKEVEVDKILG